jgi:hypothetical protein
MGIEVASGCAEYACESNMRLAVGPEILYLPV